MSLADSPSAVRQTAGDVKAAPPCDRNVVMRMLMGQASLSVLARCQT